MSLCPQGKYCPAETSDCNKSNNQGTCPQNCLVGQCQDGRGFYWKTNKYDSVCCAEGLDPNELCIDDYCPELSCPGGQYYNENQGCVTCPDGYWCPSTKTQDGRCGANQFSDGGDCQNKNGNKALRDLKIKRQLCPKGHYCNKGTLNKCPDPNSDNNFCGVGTGFYKSNGEEYRSICLRNYAAMRLDGSITGTNRDFTCSPLGFKYKRELHVQYILAVCNTGFYLQEKSCISCNEGVYKYGFNCDGGIAQPELCPIGSSWFEGLEISCPNCSDR